MMTAEAIIAYLQEEMAEAYELYDTYKGKNAAEGAVEAPCGGLGSLGAGGYVGVPQLALCRQCSRDRQDLRAGNTGESER